MKTLKLGIFIFLSISTLSTMAMRPGDQSQNDTFQEAYQDAASQVDLAIRLKEAIDEQNLAKVLRLLDEGACPRVEVVQGQTVLEYAQQVLQPQQGLNLHILQLLEDAASKIFKFMRAEEHVLPVMPVDGTYNVLSNGAAVTLLHDTKFKDALPILIGDLRAYLRKNHPDFDGLDVLRERMRVKRLVQERPHLLRARGGMARRALFQEPYAGAQQQSALPEGTVPSQEAASIIAEPFGADSEFARAFEQRMLPGDGGSSVERSGEDCLEQAAAAQQQRPDSPIKGPEGKKEDR